MMRRRHSRGFTLIEALAAVVFVGIVLPVVMRGFSLATQLGEAAKRRAEAATLAHSVMSELAITRAWQTGTLSGDFGDDHPEYHWQAELKAWDDSTMLELDIHVLWNSAGNEQRITVSTLVDQGTTN